MRIRMKYFPRYILIVFFLVTSFTVNSFGSDPDIQKVAFGIVHGNNHVFMVKPPIDWVIDPKLAKENNLGAIFYPEKAQNKLEVYMYATGHDKVDLKSSNIKDFIKADIENYSNNPKIKIRKLDSLKTYDNIDTYTYEFFYLENNLKEIISYIDTKSAVCILVFAYIVRNENDKYFADYKIPFVKSFKYLGDDPEKAYEVYKKFMDARK